MIFSDPILPSDGVRQELEDKLAEILDQHESLDSTAKHSDQKEATARRALVTRILDDPYPFADVVPYSQLTDALELLSLTVVQQSNETREVLLSEIRKEAEADILCDPLLERPLAKEIIRAVSPELHGESLLPLSEVSEAYLVAHRLKREEETNRHIRFTAGVKATKEMILEQFADTPRTCHPEFNEFAAWLSVAVAQAMEALQSPESEQDMRKTIIGENIRKASQLGSELGLTSEAVQTLYESILSELSESG